MTSLLHMENLRVRFGDTVAVSGVSFDLEPGRCVALVGESGSGKSVTARSLLGLVGGGAEVTADALRLDGKDLLALSEREWRELRGGDIGLVMQDALVSLDPLMRVGKQIEESIRTHERVGRREAAERARELLSRVGVPEPELRARQYPHELSGGLRQRALIASAVAAAPRVIIADEPTTALDVTVQAQVLELLQELRQQGAALILVSHDLAVVSELADEILVLSGGEVVEQGPVDQVLGAPSSPYTRQLLEAIPSEHSRGQRLSSQPVAKFQRSATPRPTAGDLETPVISAEGLGKSYPRPGGGQSRVLDDVSFVLRRGSTLGIVGESGSGKSTVANIVLGLTHADEGSVLLDGAPWSQLPERRRRPLRHRIQAISQDPLGSFDPRDSVGEILVETLAAVGAPADEREDRAVSLLQQVGLGAEHLARFPLELSGGQRQRVAISRALATEPEVLVCDEPVSALDVSIQAQVLDLLSDLQSQLDVSLLFISHDLGVIRHLADEVVVMKQGRIVEAGRTDAVFEHPRHDYTRELIAAIPTLRHGNRTAEPALTH